MSVSNLFKRMGMKWVPDADSVGAPEGALLRADNLVPDQVGALAVRSGSTRLYNSLSGSTVDSLYTVELADGTTTRMAGVGDNIFRNGSVLHSGVTGSGDIQFGDDGYQIFMARGTTKKKYGPAPSEGSTNYSLYDWGVAKPIGKPTLSASTALTASVMVLDGEDSPAPTVVEGTGTVGAATNYAGTASEATELTPSATTSRGVVERLWTSDQDFFTIQAVEGSAQDLVDIYVKFEDPARVEKVHFVFGLDNSSTEPFTNDRFEFTFDFTKGEAVELKDTEAEGYSAYEQAVSGILNRVDPKEVQSVLTPAKAKKKGKQTKAAKQPKSGPRLDPGKWGHLTVTRGQFKRFGQTAGRGWNTVRGVRVIVDDQKGYTKTATFSNMTVIGGGERALTGEYRCVICAARQLDTYVELSPPSAESDRINLNHQILKVTIPAATVNALDDQADQIWVYLFGGLLDTWYRFAIVGRSGLTETPEELTIPNGNNFSADTVGSPGPPYNDSGTDRDERSRITAWGNTMPPLSAGSDDLVVTINKSELLALMENVRLDPYTSGPPDNIVGIAGPWNGRIFCLTSKGYVHPSSNRSPSSYGDLQIVDLTRHGDPLWIAMTGNGVYVGMEKDIILLAGSGDDSEDLTYIDLYPQPLNTGDPPIDACVAVDGSTIVYRSANGLMVLNGGSTQDFPKDGTELLWRGQTRHGIEGINISTGRFRATVDNGLFYVLVPESSLTSANAVYRYSKQGGWSRLTFPRMSYIRSIYTEPSGILVAGDNAGAVWQLDTGSQDGTYDIPINLVTPVSDGGNPLANKEAHDLQIHCDTGGDTGTIALYKNGSGTAESSTYDFSTVGHSVYRHNLNDFGRFLRAQVQITGSFNTLSISFFDITYRIRPQQSMKLDTGYILPDEPGDVVWLQEVEFDANAYGNVTMELWRDGVLTHTDTITVTDGIRKPYRLPLPRESKAYRARLVFYSTDSEGEGDVGFEVYGVRVRERSSGNRGQNRYRTVYPVGNAP